MKKDIDLQFVFLFTINIVIMIVAWILIGGKFLSPFNLQSIANQIPELAFLAIGVSLAMMSGSGGIDLSGIALANLSAIVAFLIVGPFVESSGISSTSYVTLFSIVAIIVGILGGLLNGLLIGYVGIPSIIATLGTQLLFTGIAVSITGGSALTLGYIEVFDDLGNTPVLGLPLTVWFLIIVVAVIAGILRFTKFGIFLLLMGSNRVAAHFSGFPIKMILLKIYVLAGTLASFSGIVIASRTSSMKWDYGSSYVLMSILIAVMAGVRPEGGYGRMLCVLLSAFALQLLSSLLNFLEFSNFFRDFAWGILLLGSLAFSKFDFKGLLQFKH